MCNRQSLDGAESEEAWPMGLPVTSPSDQGGETYASPFLQSSDFQ